MIKKIFYISFVSVMTALILSFGSVTSAAKFTLSGYDVPIDVKLNGVYLNSSAKGYLGDDNVSYVPVEGLATAMGAEILRDDNAGTLRVTRGKNEIVFNLASSSCYANGNMSFAGLRNVDGKLYVPARFLAENLGANVSWDSYRYEVIVSLPNYNVPQEYIETYYNAEDLKWLSKIVTCEAGSVSFDAKIMVANVILNRRESPSFPNTVYEVIYDNKFGIQFPPAHNGKVAAAVPTTNTILACKVAFSGVMLVPECKYFSYTSDNFSWVYHNCTLYKVIGNQAFYK